MAKTKRQGRGKFELMESGQGGSVYYIKSKNMYEVHDKTAEKTKRSYYKELTQANSAAEKLNQMAKDFGKQMPSLTPSERRAIEIYRSHKRRSDILCVEIPEIDRLIIDALENSSLVKDSPMFDVVANQYIATQKRKGVTKEHHKTTMNRVAYLNKELPDMMVGSITAHKVQDILDRLEGKQGIAKAETVNQYRGLLSSIFRFAKSRRMIDHNPVESIPKIQVRRGRPETIQLNDLCKILSHFVENRPRLIPAVVLKAFCGVRNSELSKIKFSHICQGGKKELTIDGTIAKNSHTRFTPISDNALAWIEVSQSKFKADPSDYVLPSKNSIRLIIDDIKKLDIYLPQNAFRHSCASCLCALHEDYPRVASWLGHDVSVLMKNYRNAVSKQDGEAWFSVYPSH